MLYKPIENVSRNIKMLLEIYNSCVLGYEKNLPSSAVNQLKDLLFVYNSGFHTKISKPYGGSVQTP